MSYVALGDLISKAKVERCGSRIFPVLSMTMHDGILFQNDRFKKDVASVDRSNYSVVKRNQLVVSFPIDEGVLAVQDITDAGIVSPAYKIWDVKQDLVLPKYLETWLRSPRSIEYYKSKLRGTTARRRSIPEGDFLQMPVAVPSLSIQAHAIDLINRVKSILDKRTKELKSFDDLIKARFVEMFGDPRFNTKRLSLVRLGELGVWNSGGTPSRANPEYYKGDINWYSAGELNSLFLNGSIEKITKQAIEDSSAKLFKAGSILVGMYDTAAFKMGILREESTSNQACACIEPNNSIDVVWLYYELQLMKDYFLAQRRGVRQKNLNLGMIKGFEVPITDLPSQNVFTAFVTQVDKSKFTVQQSLNETQKLFDCLMQQYFG